MRKLAILQRNRRVITYSTTSFFGSLNYRLLPLLFSPTFLFFTHLKSYFSRKNIFANIFLSTFKKEESKIVRIFKCVVVRFGVTFTGSYHENVTVILLFCCWITVFFYKNFHFLTFFWKMIIIFKIVLLFFLKERVFKS